MRTTTSPAPATGRARSTIANFLGALRTAVRAWPSVIYGLPSKRIMIALIPLRRNARLRVFRAREEQHVLDHARQPFVLLDRGLEHAQRIDQVLKKLKEGAG